MFCEKCGNKVNEGASFCQSCGVQLANIATESKVQGSIPACCLVGMEELLKGF
jgi:uncharacterized membrane protein YvbJ